MSLKPIILYSHASGPNPWKVAAVLEELNIPYENKFLQFNEMKQDPFESINPNGRVPAIDDPNTGLKLWESGAIVEYLVETYDKQNTLSFATGSPEYFYAKQWLHFQMSGQGPYFGQAVWFTKFHPEDVPSAKERYNNEVKRVSSVMDRALADREWLVGNKLSYADLSFVPWFLLVPAYTKPDLDLSKEYPKLGAWLEKMKARPAVQKIVKDRENAMATHSK